MGDDTKLSLNTAGYEPSELSVNVADGQLVVEGKHTEASDMMVSRHFRRQYGLTPQSKPTKVVNLSCFSSGGNPLIRKKSPNLIIE